MRWTNRLFSKFAIAVSCVMGVLCMSGPVQATDVQSLIRLKGLESNELMGMGLVVGLDGTGESAKKSPHIAVYVDELLRNHGLGVGNPAALQGVDSVALVSLRARLPETGAREGDHFDVEVSVVGNAKSLAGGSLIQSFLRFTKAGGPDAFVSGLVEVSPDNPRTGIIRQGGQMLSDIRTSAFDHASRQVTLVIRPEYAGYPVANMLAEQITQQLQIGPSSGEGTAEVRSPNEVVVTINEWAWDQRVATLDYVLTMSIDESLLDLPARVLINRRAGVIVVTGDVQISPVVITARGLTITRINPPPAPTPADPVFTTESHVKVSTLEGNLPSADASLSGLIEALETLKIDFDTRVNVLYEMKRLGVLHAQLIEGSQ